MEKHRHHASPLFHCEITNLFSELILTEELFAYFECEESESYLEKVFIILPRVYFECEEMSFESESYLGKVFINCIHPRVS